MANDKITKKPEKTVGDILRWLEKLEKLTSEGAKVVHVKHLLLSDRKQVLGEILKQGHGGGNWRRLILERIGA